MTISSAKVYDGVKVFHLIIGLILLQYLILIFTELFLIDDNLYYSFWAEKFSSDKINQLLEDKKRWSWVSYFAIPLLTFIKCFSITICLLVGAFVLNIEKRFEDFFRVVVLAEFVALLPSLSKLTWFGLIQVNFTLNDLVYFFPLSMLNFFSIESLENWGIYPLQIINAFEVLYWLVLASLLKRHLNRSLTSSLAFVSKTYGVGLFIWVILVMFLMISIS